MVEEIKMIHVSGRVALSSVLLFATSGAASAAAYSDAVLANNPVAYWRLNETSGAAAVNSASTGASLNGTYTNFAPTPTANSGLGGDGPRPTAYKGFETLNYAPHFDRTDTTGAGAGTTADYINVGNPAALQITQNFTLEAWIKYDVLPALGNSAGIVGKYRGAADDTGAAVNERGYVLALNGAGKLNAAISSGGAFLAANSLDGTSTLAANTWYHVAAVYNTNGASATLSLYLNGVADGTLTGVSTSVFNTPAPVRIGEQFGLLANTGSGATAQGVNFFDGSIDEVAIYNTALTASTIAAHYQSAVPEPASLGLICLPALALLSRRRR